MAPWGIIKQEVHEEMMVLYRCMLCWLQGWVSTGCLSTVVRCATGVTRDAWRVTLQAGCWMAGERLFGHRGPAGRVEMSRRVCQLPLPLPLPLMLGSAEGAACVRACGRAW